MQKIPTLFLRDKANPKRVTREVDPECQWVLDGEGVPTEKFDGSACAVIDGHLYRRHAHDMQKGEPPPGWVHWSRDPAQRSGHGWLPVSASNPSDRYHLEAWAEPYSFEIVGDGPELKAVNYPDGTYELVGPKSNGNPYHLSKHELWKHGASLVFECERTFDGIAAHLAKDEDWGLAHTASGLEGIVWHHPDGRMAKIKRRDFGLKWPAF
jgi:hypothetical protein